GLRGIGPSTAVLFGMTFMTGVGIAIFFPAIPFLVSSWFPEHIGLATATYVNGLLVGETLSASLTLPIVLPLVAGRWELSFVFWAMPRFVYCTGNGMAGPHDAGHCRRSARTMVAELAGSNDLGAGISTRRFCSSISRCQYLPPGFSAHY